MSDLALRRIFFYRGHAITCQADKRSDGRFKAYAAVMVLLERQAISQRFLDLQDFLGAEEALSSAKAAAFAHVDQHWTARASELGSDLPLRTGNATCPFS